MKIYKEIQAIKEAIHKHKANGRIIGFVPTMGALHRGHLSLIDEAKKHCDIIVVSIFVNPTQFNDLKDYKNYPLLPQEDIAKLKSKAVDVLFMPRKDEMYPQADTRVFKFNQLETVMEGQFRPGHFNGVAQIVSKLFYAIEPDVAIFGEKDFQQLAIIRQMTKDLNLNVIIIGAETIREEDGLAMSSRNLRLTSEQRKQAPIIRQTLLASQSKAPIISPEELEKWVKDHINAHSLLDVEYFQVVDQDTLQPAESWQDNCDKIGCIAVYCGEVRLIDNIKYSL